MALGVGPLALLLPGLLLIPRYPAAQGGARMSLSAMPTDETGVSALCAAQEAADGRGVLVAVLDTGCDLSALGLQTTSEGAPKYVDFLDCTGGGDLDTTTTVSVDQDRSVKGLSGRKLSLGAWAEEAAEMRVGAVRLYALLPRSVLTRVKRERRAAFDAKQHAAVTAVQRELDALEAGSSLKGAAKTAAKKVRHSALNRAGSLDSARPAPSRTLSSPHRALRTPVTSLRCAAQDLELRLKELASMVEGYTDAGPLLDVLVYREKPTLDQPGIWRVVVDTTASGDLSGLTPMAPFRVERQVMWRSRAPWACWTAPFATNTLRLWCCCLGRGLRPQQPPLLPSRSAPSGG